VEQHALARSDADRLAIAELLAVAEKLVADVVALGALKLLIEPVAGLPQRRDRREGSI
jgi:hypothetical protein